MGVAKRGDLCHPCRPVTEYIPNFPLCSKPGCRGAAMSEGDGGCFQHDSHPAIVKRRRASQRRWDKAHKEGRVGRRVEDE